MSEPNAPPPSYDALFNQGGAPSAPPLPPPGPDTYMNKGHNEHDTAHHTGHGESAALNPAPYPVQPYPPVQYGAPAQPGYPPGPTYIPGQTHQGYGPNAPIQVPNQPYGQPYATGPNQYTYSTVNASTVNTGYNTTPMVVHHGPFSSVNNKRRAMIIIVVISIAVLFFIILAVVLRQRHENWKDEHGFND